MFTITILLISGLFMTDTIESLKNFFSISLKTIETDYQWQIPDQLSFMVSGQGFQNNVKLKMQFHERWKIANNENRIKITNEIISIWGGVRGNKKETIEIYVNKYSAEFNDCPLKGVASYSKLLSIIEPKRFAIYDARVAVSLNAIQFLADVKNGIIFNYIDGRNNITGNKLNKTGFRYLQPFTKKSLKAKAWRTLPNDNTYHEYLATLQDIQAALPTHHLYEFEMSLFANAEKLATKAIKKAGLSI